MKNIATVLVVLFCLINAVSKSQLTFTLPSQVCQNASIMLTSSSGTLSPLSYSWTSSSTAVMFSAPTTSSPILTFTAPGSYTISLNITSTSGTFQTSHSTSVSPFPIMPLSAMSHTICAGKGATLQVIGADSYTWNPLTTLMGVAGNSAIAYPSASTVYSVSGNSSQCGTSSINFSVFTGNVPVLVVSPLSYSVCNGETTGVTANGAQSYTWTSTNYTSSITNPSVSATVGVYTITGSNGGNCISSVTFFIYPADCTSLDEFKNPGKLHFYPNPTSEILYISSDSPFSIRFDILDMLGKVVYTDNFSLPTSRSQQIELSNLPPGIYYLRATTKDGSSEMKRFVKE